MTYNTIGLLKSPKDDSSLASGKAQSTAEGEQGSIKMQEVYRDLLPVLVCF